MVSPALSLFLLRASCPCALCRCTRLVLAFMSPNPSENMSGRQRCPQAQLTASTTALSLVAWRNQFQF